LLQTLAATKTGYEALLNKKKTLKLLTDIKTRSGRKDGSRYAWISIVA
jgi:hypothetical protein